MPLVIAEARRLGGGRLRRAKKQQRQAPLPPCCAGGKKRKRKEKPCEDHAERQRGSEWKKSGRKAKREKVERQDSEHKGGERIAE